MTVVASLGVLRKTTPTKKFMSSGEKRFDKAMLWKIEKKILILFNPILQKSHLIGPNLNSPKLI